MGQFFIHIYNYFQKHRTLLYLIMILSFAFFAFSASKIKLNEDITSVFSDKGKMRNSSMVFKHLKIKDELVVLISSNNNASADKLIKAGDSFISNLYANIDSSLIESLTYTIDDNLIKNTSDFIYDYLPIFLTDNDYTRLDSLINKEKVDKQLLNSYSNLLSPAGSALKGMLIRDPLWIGGSSLKLLEDLKVSAHYNIYKDHIFSENRDNLVLVISPNTSKPKENEALVDALDASISNINKSTPEIVIDYFGGIPMSVGNARVIKKEVTLTVSLALLIIIIFIFFAFTDKRSIFFILIPIIYGTSFAFSMIYFLNGSISAIAIGAGATVIGIALSYSIHVLSHNNHVDSIPQLLEEISFPLTIGSTTTIGAFVGLMYTNSNLLQDFGLFASLSLVGTIICCLIFMPHFLDVKTRKKTVKKRFIDKITNYSFDKNKKILILFLIAIPVCLFFSRNVGFDGDIMNLNFYPKNLKQAEQKIKKVMKRDSTDVLFVSVGNTQDECFEQYSKLSHKLDGIKGIKSYSSLNRFFINKKEQNLRISKWNNFWQTRREPLITYLEEAKNKHHLPSKLISATKTLISKKYTYCDYRVESLKHRSLFKNWINSSDSLFMAISHVKISDTKDLVYEHFKDDANVVIFDKSYLASKLVVDVKDDFYFVLTISGLIVFLVLLLTYGRIELALISFTPMLISWIIIIGIMGIFNIQFNIVSIILSTFVFGIGDDFAIFVMDGLLQEYRNDKKILNQHKEAILFSAFTTIVGFGVLIIAKHPALNSISWLSIIGIFVVVLVAYTIQPLMFRILITNRIKAGKHPYTLSSFIASLSPFGTFLLVCILMQIILPFILLLPIKKIHKRYICSCFIRWGCMFVLFMGYTVRAKFENNNKEIWKKPSIVISNHQSFIDILSILSLNPKIVILSKSWVWKSPLFGFLVRYAGFIHVEDGVEDNIEIIRERVKEGYSIAIFPEGKRSESGHITRFHKGAFFLANELQLDIRPAVIYGAGMCVSKKEPFNIYGGKVRLRILPLIKHEDKTWGETYQERTKNISAYFKKEYAKITDEYSRPHNQYFYNKLITGFKYKGAVNEWYMRIKVKMEKGYTFFDEIIPRDARIVDLGCGYGPLSYMLSFLSEKRTVLGVDYDQEKISLANHMYYKTKNIDFKCADVSSYEFKETDVFVINDMMHYLSFAKQEQLIKNCASYLSEDGFIIMRDGDAEKEEKHKMTKLTELFSTKILKFNKTVDDLHFNTRESFMRIFNDNNLSVHEIENDKITSNTIYILKLKK